MSSSISNSKSFTLAVLACAGLTLLTAIGAMELFLRRQVTQETERQAYHHRFHTGSAPWIAIGDSHVANGLLSSPWLDNLGQPSDNLNTIIGKFRMLLQRGNLQGVILQADPLVFSFYRLSANQTARLQELKDPEATTGLYILRPQNRPYLVSLLKTLAQDPKRIFAPPAPPAPQENISLPDKTSEEWKRSVAIRIQLHTPISDLANHPSITTYRLMVQEAKAHGLQTCLVSYPVSETYRQMMQDIPGFQQAMKVFQTIANEEKVPLIDLSDMLPEESFGDPDHVLPNARPLLTEQVRQACGATAIPE